MEPNLYVLRIVEVFLKHYGYSLMSYHQEFAQAVLFNRKHKVYPLIIIDGGDAIIPKKTQMTQQLLQNLNLMFGKAFEPLNLYLYSEASVRIGQGFIEDPKVKEQFPKLLELSYTTDSDPQIEFSQLWQKIEVMNKAAVDGQLKSQQRRQQPWITIALIGITLVMYSISQYLAAQYGSFTNAILLLGAMYQPFVQGAFELWRFITPAFLHGSLFHWFANMYSLYVFGRLLEPLFGRWKFLLVFVSSVIMGNLFVYFGSDTTVTVGMSGGLYGLMAWYIMYTIEANLIKLPQFRTQILTLLGINLMINFFPNISWLSHLGGFIAGLFFALLWSKKEPLKGLRVHGMVAMVLLIVGLGYYRWTHPLSFTIYPGTDKAVVDLAHKLNLESYGQNLESKMIRYYLKEGLK